VHHISLALQNVIMSSGTFMHDGCLTLQNVIIMSYGTCDTIITYRSARLPSCINTSELQNRCHVINIYAAYVQIL